MRRSQLPYRIRMNLDVAVTRIRIFTLAHNHFLLAPHGERPIVYCNDGVPSRLQVAVWNG